MNYAEKQEKATLGMTRRVRKTMKLICFETRSDEVIQNIRIISGYRVEFG